MSDKPCKDCPFRRSTPRGELGGSDPRVYIGQAYGPFFLPCHNSPGYFDDKRSTDNRQCVGAATFRANCGIQDRFPPALLRAPSETVEVFANPAEFLSHHEGIPEYVASFHLSLVTPDDLMLIEMRRSGVQTLGVRS